MRSRRDLRRELRVLALYAQGKSRKEISEALGLHPRSVSRYRKRWEVEGPPCLGGLEGQVFDEMEAVRSDYVKLGLLQLATRLALARLLEEGALPPGSRLVR